MLGIVGSKKYRKYFALRPDYVTADEQAGSNPKVWFADNMPVIMRGCESRLRAA
jgi:hypothetical protein